MNVKPVTRFLLVFFIGCFFFLAPNEPVSIEASLNKDCTNTIRRAQLKFCVHFCEDGTMLSTYCENDLCEYRRRAPTNCYRSLIVCSLGSCPRSPAAAAPVTCIGASARVESCEI